MRVQEVGLCGADDADVLAAAADGGQLILTHDRATFPTHAFQRVIKGHVMPGVIVVSDRLPLRIVIDELELIARCSEPMDWNSRVLYLPL